MTSILTDVLLVALVMKLITELLLSKLIPWYLFVISVIGLPFLLGLGSRSSQGIVSNITVSSISRTAVAIAGLCIFIFSIKHNPGVYNSYLFMVGIGLMLYLMARLAQRMLRSLLIALVIVAFIVVYLLTRLVVR